ncbi:hypothetical protein Tc00.1047053507473.20 [Trypanosoma cruzi]|uniref:Uncharacterized protein n=1 Tax=Trypanosoma cruzi (strain CL Brener) TaxID=353153 RepID=Q4CWN7_TRYCC|nr:hypothetical protein Tc00.1047053507473.20 [Trypanosoma cruzi]EAN84689.1 hypothetical protein Tc00.1047053507473.20 [Trypanosoma cruzi]|eukprot:XP_806540.1 hypothetical protein [Trypanosoma cruzi strain CL Brener]
MTAVAPFTMEIASCDTTRRSRCAQSPSHFPPFPLPESSLMAVAHPPTCQKALVFLPSHFAQQHRQPHFISLYFTYPLPSTLPILPSAHLRSCRLPFGCSHHPHGPLDCYRLAALRFHQHHWE